MSVSKQKPQEMDDSPRWLMTFADMMTLLFAFFVLLFAMSTLDPVKMSAMADAMDKESGRNKEMEAQPLDSQNQIQQKLKKMIEEMGIQSDAKVTHDARGVALELKGDITFTSGSVELHWKMIEILDELIPKLMSNDNDLRPIIVEGHSDNEIPAGDIANKYPTNWELSSARAAIVVRYLVQKNVSSGRLIASGYADRWPSQASWQDIRKGVVSENYISEMNATIEQKAKNRRIKIIFTR
ncbi:MAG: OmpA family protein [Candidatus Marinimicrobia bacterium]|nr:OmpA family protein [Candidatus Neomarinimicrobiota bacterium]MBL7023593.1 OmpA family protein [Candidatus Neomarinimicrobiota bacterium]MBL7109523.1 OmpA family protein [Candidatus Neomarinimicrobiota bacterium]